MSTLADMTILMSFTRIPSQTLFSRLRIPLHLTLPIKHRISRKQEGSCRSISFAPHALVEDVKDSTLDRVTPVGTIGTLTLRKELVAALHEAEIESLTEIQEKAIPIIRQMHDVLIASHTGSGKTYAYLLPIVERLKKQEEMDIDLEPLRTKRPRAIVLGPTRELTDQILKVTKSLSHHAKFCSTLLNAGIRLKTRKMNLGLHQDIVVATPSMLLEHHSARHVSLRDVQVLVLDEADTMFDEHFLPDIKQIVTILQKKHIHCQFILVAATATKGARAVMRQLFPELQIVETSTLHKGVSGCSHKFLNLKPGQDKLRLLKDVLEADVRKRAKVMVFCNTLNSCRAIEHSLQEHNIATICYHGEIPKLERKEIIEQFSGIDNEGHVLVCTDLAARGLDIPGRVDHIINFDFPLTPVDYLHRSGRTARAGARGKVTSLVTGKDRVLADRIKWAVKHDLPLDDLTSKKHIAPPSLRPKRQVIKRQSLKGLRGEKRAEMMKQISKDLARKRKLAAKSKGRSVKGRH